MHVDSAVWPRDVEYLPAPQSVHAAEPAVVLYLPATHCEHAPPSGPVQPALQVQSTSASLAEGALVFAGQVWQDVTPTAVEYWPAEQSVHAALPSVFLNFPATHAPHGPPFAQVYPSRQMQFVCAELPAGDRESAGQFRHVSTVVAPKLDEYVFALHSAQEYEPLTGLYLPAEQMTHCGP